MSEGSTTAARRTISSALLPPIFRTQACLTLASPDAQKFFYEPLIADRDLVIVDNLFTICRGMKENEADSWVPVQNWALGHFDGPASPRCSFITVGSPVPSAAPSAKKT